MERSRKALQALVDLWGAGRRPGSVGPVGGDEPVPAGESGGRGERPGLSRRDFLLTAGAVGVAGGALGVGAGRAVGQEEQFGGAGGSLAVPGGNSAVGDVDLSRFDPSKFLRNFYEGEERQEGGRTVREYEIVSEDVEIEVAPGVMYPAWAFNGQVPGPTLRAREGERLRIVFKNRGAEPHSIHFHGIHPANMDGVFEQVGPGQEFVYEFEAEPFGMHLYQCHTEPVSKHVAKGLYGAFVVDPKEGRPEADEMVMVMNGFDTNFDNENDLYTVNGVAFHYQRHPVKIKKGELIRVYLANWTEFDFINSIHLHANFFDYYPTGTRLEPAEFTDVKMLAQGERGIMEFRYDFPGNFMFQAHKSEFAELGWSGFFRVEE